MNANELFHILANDLVVLYCLLVEISYQLLVQVAIGAHQHYLHDGEVDQACTVLVDRVKEVCNRLKIMIFHNTIPFDFARSLRVPYWEYSFQYGFLQYIDYCESCKCLPVRHEAKWHMLQKF